ncbi:hypothetical protein [Flavobacterium sp.]|uniref:hypothetical protein n=1 Tax=Flavobacterium sp. TaxID=239 RepID=UPI002FD9CD08
MHKKITVSSEPKIIGVKNGIMQVELDRKNLLNQDGSHNKFYKYFGSFPYWANQNNKIDFNISVINAKPLKKAKMTDLLAYGPYIMAFKWLISEKFYNILQDFNIGEHTLYEVNIENCEEKYFFLKLKTILRDEFVFNRNVLTVLEKNSFVDYTFLNKIEYDDFILNNPLSEYKHIALKQELEKYDIIYTQGAGDYFSERLIKTFNENGLTGLSIYNNRSIEFV